jgi:hypothetical protein
MALPNFIIIGAQKAGTCSLYEYLSLHPQIFMSREKELDFFVQERNWGKGIDWYESQFPSTAPARGEASPLYTNWPEYDGVPERIHSIIPDAKLIYLVRDPVQRMVSQYVMDCGLGYTDLSFADAVRNLNDDNPLFCRSKFFAQISQYLRYFPKSSLCVVSLDMLRAKPGQVMQMVFRFLGVDESFSSPNFSRVYFSSELFRLRTRVGRFVDRFLGTRQKVPLALLTYPLSRWEKCSKHWPFSTAVAKPVLEPALKHRLADGLKDDVARLREWTGCPFETWSL